MKRLIALGMLAACGDDGGPGGPATITVATTTAELHPDLLAVREGEGDWQVLPPETRTFDVAADRYEVLFACATVYAADITFRETIVFGYTTADPHEVRGCVSRPTPGNDYVEVGLGMVQPGTINFGSRDYSGSTAMWTAQVGVNPGTYDAVGFDDDRIAVSRAIAVTGDVTLPALDLTQGAPFETVTFELAGVEPGTASAFNLVQFANNATWDHGTEQGGTLQVVPDALLADDDLQYIAISATQNVDAHIDLERGAEVDYRSSKPRHFDAPAPIEGFAFDGTTLRWTSTPAFDSLGVLRQAGDGTSLEFVSHSAGFAAGETEMSFDHSAIPGYDPAWQGTAAYLTFGAYQFLDAKQFDDVYARVNWHAN